MVKIKKIILLLVISSFIVSCGGPITMLTSGAGFVGSSDIYIKAYNGIDFSTTLVTKKDIKTHIYQSVKDLKKVSTKINVMEQKPNTLILVKVEIEKLSIKKNDLFKLCYLSFFLAISVTVFLFVLGYGFLSLRPIKKNKKKRKKNKK